MDSARGFDEGVGEVTLAVGGDERRMHVRAYNHWVSLLGGRPYPSIEDLDPGAITGFSEHSVLLDFTRGIEDPRIQYLGRAVREECGIDGPLGRISEVPSRSLLSRLTDHYLQIIANRAPIGFEAEFVGIRGHNTLYRGILMPFSSNADTIDFIYGVINWKELVDADVQAQIHADLDAAVAAAPVRAAAPAAVWADGPGADGHGAEGADAAFTPTMAGADDRPDEHPAPVAVGDDASLADRLADARDHAEAFARSEGRSRAALYGALARAHALARAAAAHPDDYAALLADAGLRAQARAPLTPLVKLVFGVAHDKTRLAEYATVLAHAERHDIAPDALAHHLEGHAGGVKGVVAAERALRRRPAAPDRFAAIADELRSRPPLARVEIDAGDAADGDFVVLLARAAAGGLQVVARVEGDAALTARALRAAA